MAEEEVKVITNDTEGTPIETPEGTPIETPAVEVVLAPAPSWGELGEYEAIKSELTELRELKSKVEGLPLEKIEFLKRGGDPVEALREYEKAFSTDYEKESPEELVKKHLMEKGKNEKQANFILNQFLDMDEELDDDFEEKNGLWESYVKEAKEYFQKAQQDKRAEYEKAMGLDTPQELLTFIENAKEVKLEVNGEVGVSYNVPVEYVEEARTIMKTLPQMRNVPESQYNETLQGILWLNSDVRAKIIDGAVKAAVKQTEERLQKELAAKEEKHKAELLRLSGVPQKKAEEIQNNGTQYKTQVPDIKI